MSVRAMPIVAIVVLLTTVGGGTGAAAADAPKPDWTPEGLVRQVGGDDANVRRVAAIRLRNLDGTHLAAVEQAAARDGLSPEARDALKAALPPLQARARRLKLDQEVRAYELRATLDAYERTGAKDPKWDGLVKEAMGLFSAPQPVAPAQVAAAFRKALDAGCADPLVQFLYARAAWSAGPQDKDAVLALHRRAALEMPKTKHPTEFSWRAAVRYLEQSRVGDEDVVDVALAALPKALAETGRSNRDVAEFIGIMHAGVARALGQKDAFERIYPVYATARPAGDAGPLVYKGSWHIEWAWAARGGGLAHTVTPDGWKLFAERLAVAREALEQAWKVDPQDDRIALYMITVLKGQDGNKGEMEMWFRRGMKINPDNRALCMQKLQFLFPRWHGSEAEMLVFGRQCLATQNWWGPIPTVLVDAHMDLAVCGPYDPWDYYKQPEVWSDIEAVYRSFLEVFPDSPRAPWYRNTLARWACDCGQWEAAHALFNQIGDEPDLSVFRSMAVYNYYRKKAQRRANRVQEVRVDPL